MEECRITESAVLGCLFTAQTFSSKQLHMSIGKTRRRCEHQRGLTSFSKGDEQVSISVSGKFAIPIKTRYFSEGFYA